MVVDNPPFEEDIPNVEHCRARQNLRSLARLDLLDSDWNEA